MNYRSTFTLFIIIFSTLAVAGQSGWNWPEDEATAKEKNLRPGDLDWFKLWFSRPYWKGQEYPPGLRGRKR